MATRPYFTDAEVAALAAVYAEICADLDTASRTALAADLDQLALAARPAQSRLLRMRFPGVLLALALAGAVAAVAAGSLVAAALFSLAAVVFAALIATVRPSRARVGGER